MKILEPIRNTRRHLRRSFTLAELILAGVITSFVLGGVATSLSNLSKAKLSSRQRLEAFLRADSALEMIRRDVASIIRHDDLFFTRFLLIDGTLDTIAGRQDRDELLIFSNRLLQMRDIEYNGEGSENEIQYRVQEEGYTPILWQRRDPFPDQYPRGGGLATPMVDSIVSLNIEAYDGYQWRDEWDSDYEGMPHAVRITVTASGENGMIDVYEAPFATLRTIVSLDRILLPRENLAALYEIEMAEKQEEFGELGTGGQSQPASIDALDIDPSQLPPGVTMDMIRQGILEGNSGSGEFTQNFDISPEDMERLQREERINRGEAIDEPRPGRVRPGTTTGSRAGGRSSGGGNNR